MGGIKIKIDLIRFGSVLFPRGEDLQDYLGDNR